jgi:hypothetical protein
MLTLMKTCSINNDVESNNNDVDSNNGSDANNNGDDNTDADSVDGEKSDIEQESNNEYKDDASFVNQASGAGCGQLRQVHLMMCNTVWRFPSQHPIFIIYLTVMSDLPSLCLNSQGAR